MLFQSIHLLCMLSQVFMEHANVHISKLFLFQYLNVAVGAFLVVVGANLVVVGANLVVVEAILVVVEAILVVVGAILVVVGAILMVVDMATLTGVAMFVEMQ